MTSARQRERAAQRTPGDGGHEAGHQPADADHDGRDDGVVHEEEADHVAHRAGTASCGRRWPNMPTIPTAITPSRRRGRPRTSRAALLAVHRTTTLVTHFVCSTPGRLGPMSRSGAAVVGRQRLPLDVQGQQRVAVGDLVPVHDGLAVQARGLQRDHLDLGGFGHADGGEEVAHGDALPAPRRAPPFDAGDRQRGLTLRQGAEIGHREPGELAAARARRRAGTRDRWRRR